MENQTTSTATAKAKSPTMADLQAEIARLKAAAEQKQKLTLKVSEKGAISVYGLGRFPVTLYKAQMERLIEIVPQIAEFIKVNAASLKNKE
jgi:hypothetical protein